MWKHANVVPIYKGAGSKYDENNYRPISLTSNISKIMEGIICEKITDYCNRHSILPPFQYGFRKSKSTVSNLVELLDNIAKSLNKGSCVDIITIDLSKAFDTISHIKLLRKLKHLGFSDFLLYWMKSFLCERTFSVVCNGTFSERRKVKNSVPQGTKCGPLMFNLYTSDISNVLKYCKILMYADDITLYAEINNATDRDKFQTDITNLYAWVQCWGLKINFTKCHCMHFGHKNKSFDYYIAGNIVKPSDCKRILKVLVDKDLTSQQMYACSKKASNVCNMILSNLCHFNNSLLALLFCVFARPHIEYASVIYNPDQLQYIDLLENVQRKFTKRLHGLYNVFYCERLIACK